MYDERISLLQHAIVVQDHTRVNETIIVKVSNGFLDPKVGWILGGITVLYFSIMTIHVCRKNREGESAESSTDSDELFE